MRWSISRPEDMIASSPGSATATMAEQVQHKDDEEQLVRIDRRSREQLADLFEEDREALRKGRGGEGG